MSRRKTDEQFQKEFQEHGNKSIKILGQYVTQKTLIPVECRICGYKWNAWPDSLLRGSGCSKCANRVRLTDEEFAKKLLAVNPNIEIVGNYINTHKHIKIKCKICGHEWAAMPSNLLRNYGCPKCNGGIKQSTNAFLSRMKLYHHDIEVLGNYINSLTPITVKCRRCGNIWNAAPNSMLNGNKSGCPACAHNQSSFLEQLILAFCKSCFGAEKVLSRNRNIIGSELDIVVLGNNQKPIFAIEPGSWTLHKDNYEKDIKKIIECKRRDIELLIIYDQDLKREVVEAENIWSYEKSFSYSKKDELEALLCRISTYFSFSAKYELDELMNIAYNNSRRMSTDDFRNKLFSINPDIELLGEYNGSMKKTKVKCKICGSCWSPTPQMLLLYKTGCPKCHNVPHKDTASFISEMSRINPNITIQGDYINARTKIKTMCNICGHVWFPVPDKLRIGRGCPKCAKKKISLSLSI